jgi:hypothetical protein
MSVKFRNILLIVLALVLLGLVPTAMASQETCPNSAPWVKVDGLTDTTYTYNIPAGKTLVEVCYKASTTVNYLTVNIEGPATYTVVSTVENQNGQVQDLSHASFRLEDTEDPCEGDDCEPPCEGNECPCEGNDCPCEGDDCEPPCEGNECPCEGNDCPCEGDDCEPPCELNCEPPVCERVNDCDEEETPPPPPSGPIGCVLSPLLLADAGNSVVLTSIDGSQVYYTYPIEARGDHSVVNIGVWTNVGIYGLRYADGRVIGLLTITASSHGDLTCVWTNPQPEEEVIVCVGCGPRVEEWYLNPESGQQGRVINYNGAYYVESPVSFDGASLRETPLGPVYYGTLESVLADTPVYVPCSVTVTLSQATINADDTWTFTVLAMQWRSEWELAAQRYGFGQDFVDAAMATPVGGTFTVSAPS